MFRGLGMAHFGVWREIKWCLRTFKLQSLWSKVMTLILLLFILNYYFNEVTKTFFKNIWVLSMQLAWTWQVLKKIEHLFFCIYGVHSNCNKSQKIQIYEEIGLLFFKMSLLMRFLVACLKATMEKAQRWGRKSRTCSHWSLVFEGKLMGDS